MEGHELFVIAGYAVAIFLVSIAGGFLPNIVRMTHTRVQLIMAFVAGLVLGVAVWHLLPHAIASIDREDAVELVVSWMMAGLLVTLVLMYLFDFHEHDFSDEHRHAHDKDHGAPHLSSFSWVGISLGLGVHALTEGIALSSTMRISEQAGHSIAGFGIFLAILLHKPLDALSIVGTMKASGFGARERGIANFLFALVCPSTLILSYVGAASLGTSEAFVIGCALAFAAGTFLCVALSDLLPEIHFHSHDRLLLAAAFFVGVGLAYGLYWVEPSALHGRPHAH